VVRAVMPAPLLYPAREAPGVAAREDREKFVLITLSATGVRRAGSVV